LYQTGDQYGTAVATPLNVANGRFDVQVQFAATDLYGDLLGYFKRPGNYGGTHTITGLYATDSGGVDNTASGEVSTVGGGQRNKASGYSATVAGGGEKDDTCSDPPTGGIRSCGNAASGDFSTVGGGAANIASGVLSTVAGGGNNTASS